jgi:hypothetical protein
MAGNDHGRASCRPARGTPFFCRAVDVVISGHIVYQSPCQFVGPGETVFQCIMLDREGSAGASAIGENRADMAGAGTAVAIFLSNFQSPFDCAASNPSDCCASIVGH